METITKHIIHKETTKTKVGNHVKRIKTKTIEEGVQEFAEKEPEHKKKNIADQLPHKKKDQNQRKPKKKINKDESNPKKLHSTSKKIPKLQEFQDIVHKTKANNQTSIKESFEETIHKKPHKTSVLRSKPSPKKTHTVKINKPRRKTVNEE